MHINAPVGWPKEVALQWRASRELIERTSRRLRQRPPSTSASTPSTGGGLAPSGRRTFRSCRGRCRLSTRVSSTAWSRLRCALGTRPISNAPTGTATSCTAGPRRSFRRSRRIRRPPNTGRPGGRRAATGHIDPGIYTRDFCAHTVGIHRIRLFVPSDAFTSTRHGRTWNTGDIGATGTT